MNYRDCRLVLAVFFAMALNAARLPAAAHAAESGDIVALFKAKDLEGRPVSLADLVAKGMQWM